MLAVTRLATYHPNVLQKDIHTIIGALVYEVKNLRSSVARSAIFTLGELFVRMKKQVEPVRFSARSTISIHTNMIEFFLSLPD